MTNDNSINFVFITALIFNRQRVKQQKTIIFQGLLTLNIINSITEIFTLPSFLSFSFSFIPRSYSREYRLIQKGVGTVKLKVYRSRVFVLF